MKVSGELLEFLQRNPLPYMYYDYKLSKLIVVADNLLLTEYRECPQHFVYNHVFGYQPKSIYKEDEKQRTWYLEFGILVHTILERYYENFRKPGFDPAKWAPIECISEWQRMKMDIFSEHAEYKSIGGAPGFVGMMMQYALVMTAQNEKLRILGAEVSFGRNKEVPLLITDELEFYLAGRMDLIVDDGYFICPMDHKTQGYFRSDPALQYETEEGPAGYIFAMSKILPTFVPQELLLKRDCSKILMNLISKKPTNTPQERFKRFPIRKTSYQLDQYQDRMITTIMHLVNDMENLAHELSVPRNTAACTNWHKSTCQYRDVCRQGSGDAELTTLSNGFLKQPLWNTEEVKQETK